MFVKRWCTIGGPGGFIWRDTASVWQLLHQIAGQAYTRSCDHSGLGRGVSARPAARRYAAISLKGALFGVLSRHAVKVRPVEIVAAGCAGRVRSANPSQKKSWSLVRKNEGSSRMTHGYYATGSGSVFSGIVATIDSTVALGSVSSGDVPSKALTAAKKASTTGTGVGVGAGAGAGVSGAWKSSSPLPQATRLAAASSVAAMTAARLRPRDANGFMDISST
jgi:hypothetical protein